MKAAASRTLSFTFVVYLIVCASTFGLFSLGPVFGIHTPWGIANALDLCWAFLLVSTLRGYLIQRRLCSADFRRLEKMWIAFTILVAYEGYRSPAASVS